MIEPFGHLSSQQLEFYVQLSPVANYSTMKQKRSADEWWRVATWVMNPIMKQGLPQNVIQPRSYSPKSQLHF